MAVVFDYAKSERNIQERNLSFQRAVDFEFETALFEIDARKDYGEVRIRALGYLDGQLHSLVFTERGLDMRIISFRRASYSEAKRYAKFKS